MNLNSAKLNEIGAKERNFGIDFLRIVSMFMVVMLHVLGRGGILDNVAHNTFNYYFAWALEICSYCALNCYAIISGYVGYTSTHRTVGIIKITFSVIFYTVVGTIVCAVIFNDVTTKDIISSLLHLRSGGYWYYRAYLGAFFFFPLLNAAIEKIDRKLMKKCIILLLVIYSVMTTITFSDLFSVQGGYSPVWLMVIYLIGAYIRKYNIDFKKSVAKHLGLYIISTLISFVSMLIIGKVTSLAFGSESGSRVLISYVSPTMVFSAVMLLIAFSNIKIGKRVQKIIKFCAPLTFGVYLAHMQYFVRIWLSGRFAFVADFNPVLFVVLVIAITGLIYVLGSMVDYVRECLFRITRINTLAQKTADLIDKLIYK